MTAWHLAVQLLLAVCAAGALGILLRDHLSRRGFSAGSATAMVAFALFQPVLLAPGVAGSCYVFALFGYLVGAGAENFAQHQDVRRIVLLGGAIAGAELVNPAGGVLAAALLPFVLRPEEARTDALKTTGFLFLLLFLPVLFACAIAYVRLARHIDTIGWFAMGKPSIGWAALTIAPMGPALAFGRSGTLAASAVAIVSVAWWAGSLLLASLDHGNCSLAILASMGPLAILLIAGRVQSPRREREALVASSLGLGMSWAVAGAQYL